MKDTQKRFLGAVLAASSVAGIVAPSVTAMATVVDDESNATAEDLKNVIAEYTTKLEANPIFANYHRVQYAAERLAKFDAAAADAAKANIAKYADKVFTKEVTTILDKMNDFASSKSMATYDALVTKDIKAMENKENADYLMGRLDVWGKGIVFEVDPNYVVATDAIIKVADLRKAGKLDEAQKQAEAAKKAIKDIKTYDVNGAYLEAALKVESDAVENEIANQDLHVTSVVAKNGKEVEVKFNKAVSKDSAEKKNSSNEVENFEITAANSDAKAVAIDKAELQDDNKTVLLTLKDANTLNNKENAKYLVKIHDVLTENDEEMSDYSEVISLFDNVKPEVAGLEYKDSDTLRVNLSEPVRLTSVKSAIKIKLNGANVTIPDSAIVKVDKDNMYFEISKSKAALDDDKTYSLEIDGLTDFAANALSKFTSDISFKKDDVDPTVEKIEALSSQDFRVTFSEKVNVKRTNTDDEVKSIVTGFDIKVDGKDQAVQIKDNEKLKDADDKTFTVHVDGLTEGNHVVTIYNYSDLAGNKGENTTKEIKFEAGHPVLVTNTPEYKTIAGDKYAVYSFDRDVNVGATKTVEVKHVDSDGVTVTKYSNIKDHSFNADIETNEIAVNIDKDKDGIALEEGKYNFDFETSNVKDTYADGQKIEKTSLEFTKSAKGSKINVVNNTIATVGDDNDKIVLKFDDELTKQGILDAADASKYLVDGNKVFEKAEVMKDAAGKTNTVKLTLKEDAIDKTATKLFEVSGIDGVKDFNETTTNQLKENTTPKIDKAEAIAYDTIRLTMSEDNLTKNGNPIEVRANGDIVKLVADGVKVNGNVITIKLDGKVKSTDTITVKVLDDDNNIMDKALNKTKEVTKNVEVNYDESSAIAEKSVGALEATIKDKTVVTINLSDAKANVILAQADVDKVNNASEKSLFQTRVNDCENAIKAVEAFNANDIETTNTLVTAMPDSEVFTKLKADLTGKISAALKDAADKKAVEQAASELKTLTFDATATDITANPVIVKPVDAAEITYALSVKAEDSAVVAMQGENVKVTRDGSAPKSAEVTVTIKKGTQQVTKVFVVTIPTGTDKVTIAAK